MKVIGVNDGHNASCVLVEDGKVTYALQEERMSRIKNHEGFPRLALHQMMQDLGLQPDDVDWFIFCSHYVPRSHGDREVRIRAYKRNGVADYLKRIAKKLGAKRLRVAKMRASRIAEAEAIGIHRGKIQFLDHHYCHAASAYYGSGGVDDEVLVLTNDGAGDDLCATVSIGRGGRLERIASVHMDHSIGELWAIFTAMMGMVPLEHEYKIMGLAPYTGGPRVARAKQMFWDCFEFLGDGLTWKVKSGCPPIPYSYTFFRELMEFQRFDYIAAGLQAFTEEFLCQWVMNAIKKTGIKKVVLAGGTFMNVKANKRIHELRDVESLFIFPSCGDETLPFGAAYHVAYHEFGKVCPLEHLYLGRSFSDSQIKESCDRAGLDNHYRIHYCDDIVSTVARVLANGSVVGWFQGREEFGARALGGRSLIADPTKPGVIKEINEMIKSRDFWMPFAASMDEDGAERYLVNPKGTPAPYMILTFDTTEYGLEIEAGRHPYDRTCRPQVVDKKYAPKYYRLIKEFAAITGKHGILNTSLNLHGLPIASSPQDAFEVIDRSGLRYLAIENWLIEKIS